MAAKRSGSQQVLLALSGTWLWVAAALSLPSQKDILTLPPNFILGAATSAYQIEGGWNEGGRGESVWDHAVHQTPQNIADRSTGDVACDSFHHYQKDVQMIRELGFNAYRISLSWTRILPNGTINNINKEGIQYYNALIDEMIKYNITPVVTLFHWEMPWKLQEMGGWTNPYTIDYFEDFARLAIASFGDRVKLWITLNEPFQVCEFGYSNTMMAPFYNLTGVAGYLCTHNFVLAHARVYRMYKDKFAVQKGKMGLTIHSYWYEPEDPNRKEDLDAAERAMEFNLGWSANPVYGKDGDYPAVLRRRVDLNSIAEGLTRSRLPTYTSEQIRLIKGSADFLGLNHYCSIMVKDGPFETTAIPSLERDSHYKTYNDPSWEGTTTFFKNTPWGFRKLLNWIKNHYGNIPVLVTENGIADDKPLLNDDLRVRYHSGYMKEMLKAIYEDGCNVFGYMAWSLMDNFEWTQGFSWRFGLYQVDFTDPLRPRTPKTSALWFKNVTIRDLEAASKMSRIPAGSPILIGSHDFIIKDSVDIFPHCTITT